MKTKYVAVLADFHCGHLVGLTPPKWQYKTVVTTKTKRNKFFKIQQDLWKCYVDIVKQLPELDAIVLNGDLIEGKGKKNKGAELITTLMQEQADMACDVIQYLTIQKAKKGYKLIGTIGTPYHTESSGDQWEHYIADKLQFDKLGSHEWLDVNGVIMDFKHRVGSSSVPHGRHTSVARAGLWNDLWSLEDMQPNAQIIVRSHVHYFTYCGNSRKLCMTTPALQGMGSRYGSLICEGTVDWGLVLFEIKSKDEYNFYPFIHKIKSQKVRAVKL